MWHSFYLPLVLLSIAGLVNQCASLARPQWAWLPPTARLLTTIFSLVVVNFMINAASQTPNGEWHPFVVLANSVHGSAQLNRVAAYVNLSVLLTVLVTWFGLAIAVVVQAWVLLRHLRKRTAHARDPALLCML
jgi:cytochrome oxidase assembly protein ShyY1